jgi:hypothetical protein
MLKQALLKKSLKRSKLKAVSTRQGETLSKGETQAQIN